MPSLALLSALAVVPSSAVVPIPAVQPGRALLADRAAWGVLRLLGPDARRFLHQQSTNAFEGIQSGDVREAVVTTSAGRMRDLVCAATIAPEEILLVCSPGRAPALAAEFDMFIFPADQVEVADASSEFCVLSLLGEGAASSLGSAQLGTPPTSGRCAPLDADGGWALSGTGLAIRGVTLLMRADRAIEMRNALEGLETVVVGPPALYETYSVLHGRPRTGLELSKEHNPLEAGLQRAVSFQKGCYIGQETIAKLATNDGVKQRLCGLRLSAPLPPHTKLFVDAGEALAGEALAGEALAGEAAARASGVLTGCLETAENGVLGLGYVRTRGGFELCDGLALRTADGKVEATVYELPLAPLTPELDLSKDGAATDADAFPVTVSV